MVEASKSAVAFVGPSFGGDMPDRLFPDNVLVCPPVRRGDVERLPASIASVLIIDGVFHAALAVSAREILAALSKGVKVYGSSSMGALRAAELDSYGMIGVGKVYQMYKDGEAQSDAEVALIFSEHDAIPLSEPLVNIRHSVSVASARGCLAPHVGAQIIAIARSLHYADLTYASLFERLAAELAPGAVTHYRQLVEENRLALDLKRLDAIALAAHFRAVTQAGLTGAKI
jgi:hypothetical protein